MRTKAAQLVGLFGIIGDDHASIAGASEVLRWEKREAPVISDRTSTDPFVLGAECLRRIFDDEQVVSARDAGHGAHVRHLAVKMDGDDSVSLARKFRFDMFDINVVRRWINVNEHRGGTQSGD